MLVDMLLRVASIVVLGILIYQLWFSWKYTARTHFRMGQLARVCGIVITACIIIRAYRHDGPMTVLYGAHLLTGGLFLGFLFATVAYGLRTKADLSFRRRHLICARSSLAFLCLTLIVGVASRMSH